MNTSSVLSLSIGSEVKNFALPTIPNDITNLVLQKLDLPDVNTFLTTSHAAPICSAKGNDRKKLLFSWNYRRILS